MVKFGCGIYSNNDDDDNSNNNNNNSATAVCGPGIIKRTYFVEQMASRIDIFQLYSIICFQVSDCYGVLTGLMTMCRRYSSPRPLTL